MFVDPCRQWVLAIKVHVGNYNRSDDVLQFVEEQNQLKSKVLSSQIQVGKFRGQEPRGNIQAPHSHHDRCEKDWDEVEENDVV